MKINDPIKLVFLTVILLLIGFGIVNVISYKVDLHGKFSFTHPPENPIVLKGYEVYIQEGCQYCHSLNVRTLKSDIQRFVDLEKYGVDPSIEPDEFLFFTPFTIGIRRIGPDLSTISSKYTKDELENLLQGKSDELYKKNYHNYAYLFVEDNLEPVFLSWKIRTLMNTGLPFNDPYQRAVTIALEEKTKGDALVEFLLYLGSRKAKFNAKFYQ